MTKRPYHILPIIIISQFFCTATWFAGNAVIANLIADYKLSQNDLGHLIAAVQFGFISGTLIYALLNIADRYSPSKVFFFSAALAAASNLGMVINEISLSAILSFRFFTGFFLAGIYPVGMKIASDYYEKGLGKALGYLVGALVLGTALPHLLKSIGSDFSWKIVIASTSALCLTGGLLMLTLVPDGPFRKPSQKLRLNAIFSVFKKTAFRKAAQGYFGHMWELYSFWVFIPVLLIGYTKKNNIPEIDYSLWSFIIIAVGALSCIFGGYISQKKGTQKVAIIALIGSGICCLLYPFLFVIPIPFLFLLLLLIWGMTVIADSPLFSTLVAQNAPKELKGTALTIVNCIGFAITIISIELINLIQTDKNTGYVFLILVAGPVFGVFSVLKKVRKP